MAIDKFIKFQKNYARTSVFKRLQAIRDVLELLKMR